MKFTPEVVAALATLRANAENDFELHRIDVLERDLTSPPTVEVLDDTHQRFNGVVYLKDNGGHYSTRSFLHRVVFAYFYGELPSGKTHNVHHLDRNKDNNAIDNLQLLTVSEHSRVPKKNPTEKICAYCGKSFQVIGKNRRKMCCSALCARKLRTKPDIVKTCAVCGKIFTPSKEHSNRQVCCSSLCAAKLRAEKRRDSINRKICPVCDQEFFAKKSSQLFCSRSCYMKSRHANEPAPPKIEKICPTCGKKFSPSGRNKRTVYCSISCAQKMTCKNRKAQPPTMEKVCPICHNKFLTNNPRKIFCSSSCVQKSSYKRRKSCTNGNLSD